jgi:hypothetical protein
MVGKKRNATQLVSVVALIVLSIVPCSSWAQRYCCEGESWLKWSQGRREAYVSAYIDGYYDGYIGGCQEGTKHLEPTAPGLEEFPVNKCLNRKSDFTKGIDLSRDVTAFYRRYPENRNLLIKEILEELGKGRSIADIHEHPPFPTHSMSAMPGADGTLH